MADSIVVEHISKSFKVPLDHSSTLKYRITHWRSASRYRRHHALEDVSFTVPEGQFLGITGPNGCGKSTLLKVLSQIYKPDSGKVWVEGMVSPFLELGVGFNPELTARENITLGGAMLGLSRRQMNERADSILEFAELQDFAEAKLKNFSSGMYVRLAFSVAIQADAPILLMDEVLAVGDAKFQEKCFDVFARYKRENKTIVLVTHDLNALTMYCDRAILMRNGKIVGDGAPSEVTASYRRMIGAEPEQASTASTSIRTDNRWGSREIEIADIRLLNGDGKQHANFKTGEPMKIEVDYVAHQAVAELICSLAFKRSDGLNLSAPNSKVGNYRIPGPPPGTHATARYEIPQLPLLSGAYRLTASIDEAHSGGSYDHIEDAMEFRVMDESGNQGLVDFHGKWWDSTVENKTAISA